MIKGEKPHSTLFGAGHSSPEGDTVASGDAAYNVFVSTGFHSI